MNQGAFDGVALVSKGRTGAVHGVRDASSDVDPTSVRGPRSYCGRCRDKRLLCFERFGIVEDGLGESLGALRRSYGYERADGDASVAPDRDAAVRRVVQGQLHFGAFRRIVAEGDEQLRS